MSDQPEAFRLIDTFVSKRDLAWHVSASAELRRLHEENERLNADIESWRMTLAAATTLGEKVTAENERLREDNERLRADAERYRWLRNSRNTPEIDASIDAAIDAAMKEAALRDAARQMQAGAEK